MQKSVIFVNKSLTINMLKIKNIIKLEIIVIIQGNIEVLHIAYVKFTLPKEISIVFHNGSNYDYHFIIKELAEEFAGKFIFLGESTEKYINCSVPLDKENTRIDKNRKEITKAISYSVQFIDRFLGRFMANSLSNIVNNLAEGIHKIKCKNEHDNKKCETHRIRYKNCDYFLEYTNFEDN